MMGDLYRNEGLANMKVLGSYFRHVLFVRRVVVLFPWIGWRQDYILQKQNQEIGFIARGQWLLGPCRSHSCLCSAHQST